MTEATIDKAEDKAKKDELEFFNSPDITKLMPALIDATNEFEPVIRDATNPHFHSAFSSYSAVVSATRAALFKHRLLQNSSTGFEMATGRNFVFTRVIHESGQWIGARLLLKPVREDDPQAEGSALTYAKRQTLKALLGLPEEDDDGNAAAAGSRQSRPPAARRAAAQPSGAPEPSGRDWLEEAVAVRNKADMGLGDRRHMLLELMEECRSFGELTNARRAKFVELGNEINTEIAAPA